MSTWVWIVIAAVVVIVILAIVWSAMRAKRTRALQDTFGGEYDRTVDQSGDAWTEDMGHSVRHHRALFAELLETDDDSDVENVDDVSSRDDGRVEARDAQNVERLR